jgi:hypothetical protein
MSSELAGFHPYLSPANQIRQATTEINLRYESLVKKTSRILSTYSIIFLIYLIFP